MSKKILLTPEVENNICEEIEYFSQKEIGEKYGYSQSFINQVLTRNKIKKYRKYRLNCTKLYVDTLYFKEINTPEKAYWLGYLAADGNINKSLCKCSLTSKDLEIIERFKKSISSEHKITTCTIKDKRTNNISKFHIIQITNGNFVSHLVKLGITPNKADYFKVPEINEELLHYFFAGLFDGDGHVGIRKLNKPRISLISTKEVLLFLQNYLINNFLISATKLQKITQNKKNVWKLLLYKDSLLFLNWIYSDKNFNYLSRKYEKYITFVH